MNKFYSNMLYMYLSQTISYTIRNKNTAITSGGGLGMPHALWNVIVFVGT